MCVYIYIYIYIYICVCVCVCVCVWSIPGGKRCVLISLTWRPKRSSASPSSPSSSSPPVCLSCTPSSA